MKFICLLTILIFAQYCVSKPTVDDGSIVFRDENDVEPVDALLKDGIFKTDGSGDVAGLEAKHFDMTLQTTHEMGAHFQGDLILEPDVVEALLKKNDAGDFLEERTGILDETKRWPKDSNGFVKVPYVIDSESSYS